MVTGRKAGKAAKAMIHEPEDLPAKPVSGLHGILEESGENYLYWRIRAITMHLGMVMARFCLLGSDGT